MRTYTPARRFLPVWLIRLLAGALAMGNGIGGTGTATQTLNATLQPVAELSVPATLTLSSGGTYFASFTGSLTVSYRARTTATGSGKITIQVSSDFTPAGGPSAAAGALSFTCGSADLGTPCSGSQTASTSAQTTAVTLPASACTGGGGSCSSDNPATAGVTFSLTDSPGYATGSYTAHVIFRISAT